ncbi:MAG: hypothetical protein ACYDEY_12325 [Acidimicrobiales bacterium]
MTQRHSYGHTTSGEPITDEGGQSPRNVPGLFRRSMPPRGLLVAVRGELGWPSAGILVAACGEIAMAVDRRRRISESIRSVSLQGLGRLGLALSTPSQR